MATERDFELLDDYLANRLSGEEKEAFEKKLHADVELASEHNVQQGIVDGLRRARAAELKQMLNNIPQSAIPAENTWMKWAGAAGAVVIALGIWWGLSSNESDTPTPSESARVVETPAVNNDEQTSAEDNIPVEEDKVEVQKQETSKSAAPSTEGRHQSTKSEVKSAPGPKLDVYDPSAEESEPTSEPATSTEEVPTVMKATKATIPTDVVSNDKNLKFHYEFRNQRLILYGPFDSKLYEIMEFFSSENKRTMFLYYNNSYYLLNQAGDKAKPLSPVNDPALLQKLKDSRGQ